MIDCRDCVYWGREFCCEGMDTPSEMLLGSCMHYQPIKPEGKLQ